MFIFIINTELLKFYNSEALQCQKWYFINTLLMNFIYVHGFLKSHAKGTKVNYRNYIQYPKRIFEIMNVQINSKNMYCSKKSH